MDVCHCLATHRPAASVATQLRRSRCRSAPGARTSGGEIMNVHVSSWRGLKSRFRPAEGRMYARTAFVTALMMALAAVSSLRAAEVEQLTMAEAVSLALKQN